MVDDPEADKVSTALGEPIVQELSDSARRVRASLLFFGSLTLLFSYDFLTLGDISPFGIQIEDIDDQGIQMGLQIITVYYLIYFVALTYEFFTGWRIRLTGSRLTYITGAKWTTEEGDYPDDPRQSNFYNWWQTNAKRIKNLGRSVKILEETAEKFSRLAEKYEPLSGGLDVSRFSREKTELSAIASQLRENLNALQKAVESRRIDVSMQRFDTWFKNFKTTQLLRVFLLEIGLPIAVAVIALLPATSSIVAGILAVAY